MDQSTIYALATPAPTRAAPGALAVIRISGPRASDALVFLTEPKAFERGSSARDPALPEPRRMALRPILDPVSGEEIDRGLIVSFPAPNSETGENMGEIHSHGGRAVVGAILDALSRLGFCRLAEPGEFTRRAFEHGKLDLTAAEGIADLVAAETEQQRRQALAQMDGALHRLYEDWRTMGLRALAHLEAAIDFPDEDLPPGIDIRVTSEIVELTKQIDAHLADNRGERLRQGLSIAIVGPPNAGKSSLLNLLAQRDAAIVSETAGTTRDVIEVHLDLGGWPVTLADTAGLRESSDPIELEGVRRARHKAEQADLRVVVVAADDPKWRDGLDLWTPERCFFVLNKIDLAAEKPSDFKGVTVSVKTGEGVHNLLQCLQIEVGRLFETKGPPPLTRARHREALIEARASLVRARGAQEIALAAEDLRLALRAIGRITGTVRIDELLDVIFRDFCIGK
jgi:tRNA modification GTPase